MQLFDEEDSPDLSIKFMLSIKKVDNSLLLQKMIKHEFIILS